MASTLLRNSVKLAKHFKRNIVLTSVRASDDHHEAPPHVVVDPHKGKVVTDAVEQPDSMGLCVGVERWEKLCHLNGIEDPFEMNVRAMAKGTFEEPNRVGSIFDQRTIGCICEEDSMIIQYMEVHKGQPKRCECGYWFTLEDVKPLVFE